MIKSVKVIARKEAKLRIVIYKYARNQRICCEQKIETTHLLLDGKYGVSFHDYSSSWKICKDNDFCATTSVIADVWKQSANHNTDFMKVF